MVFVGLFVYLVHPALNIVPVLRHSGLFKRQRLFRGRTEAAALGGVCSVGCNFVGM